MYCMIEGGRESFVWRGKGEDTKKWRGNGYGGCHDRRRTLEMWKTYDELEEKSVIFLG